MSDELFSWVSDVPISMPLAPPNPPALGLGAGFAMTKSGIGSNITPTMQKRLSNPSFVPKNQTVTVYEDTDLTDGTYDDDDEEMRTF